MRRGEVEREQKERQGKLTRRDESSEIDGGGVGRGGQGTDTARKWRVTRKKR